MPKKKLLLLTLILTGGLVAGIAAAGDTSPTPTEPVQSEAPATPVEPAREEGEDLSENTTVPEDAELAALFESALNSAQNASFHRCKTGCNSDVDCFRQQYHCPTGHPKACFGASGNGSCDGYCGCCP